MSEDTIAQRPRRAKLEQAFMHLPHIWHGFLSLFPEASDALAEIAYFLNR